MEYTRESIFKSAMRSFCKSFAAILGITFAIIVGMITLMMFNTPSIYPQKSDLTIAPDAQGNRELLPPTAPVVLRLDIHGVIGTGDLTTAKFTNSLLDSRDGLLANNRVKAILLHINTPGGAVDDADGIYQALMHYKKTYQVPVYAFVDGLCASGGMYIASAADQIFATAPSVIGSVGVILGPTFNFSGLMDRYGVQSLTISQGKDKDSLNPFRPWVPGEEAPLRAITADLYQRFVDIVIAGRPRLDKQKLIDTYGAQVFVAETAQKLGYIDVANTDYNSALTALCKAANVAESQEYQVITIGPMHPFFSELTQGKLSLLSGKLTHQFQMSSSIPAEFGGRFLYLYQP